MRTHIKIFIFALIISISLTFIGCKKEETKESQKLSPKEQLFKNAKSKVSKDKIKNKLEELDIAIPVGFQIDKSCKFDNVIDSRYETTFKASAENYDLIIAKIPLAAAEELKKDNDCVIKLLRLIELKDLLPELKVEFANDRIKKFSESKIAKALAARDVTDRNQITKMLEEKMKKRIDEGEQIEVLSPYQLYVTPNAEAVQNLISSLSSPQEILDFAIQKIAWIADSEFIPEYEKTANTKTESTTEYWLTPKELIEVSPSVGPQEGIIKSDCSEQANFLASALIASGMNENNVRVSLAEVDFGGEFGGHAFVQVYDPNYKVWYSLDPTMGVYIENGEMLEGIETLPFDYFLTHEYIIKEMWMSYNNKYFHNFENSQQSNAPSNWLDQNANLETVLTEELKE